MPTKPGEPRVSVLLLLREQLVAAELQLALGEHGFGVRIALSPGEAQRLISQQAPSALVADPAFGAESPVPGGFAELLKACDVPVILLLGKQGLSGIEPVLRGRAFACLHQPCNERDLISNIELSISRHEDEALARRRLELAESIVRSVDTALIATDPDGTIAVFNAAAERLTGFEAEQVKGQRVRDVLRFRDGASRQRQPCFVETVLAESQPVRIPANTVVERRTGEMVWVEDGAAPLLDERGNVRGAVLLARDVGDRRSNERRTRENERLAALGTLAAGMAHQVNNPLMCLTTNLSELRDALERSEQGSLPLGKQACDDGLASTSEALEGVKRVRKVVTDLMTYARREAPTETSAPIDVAQVIQNALQIVSGEFGKRVRCVTIVRDPPKVWAHEARLCQIIVNLLVNGAQAIPAGRSDGEVSISAHGAGAWTLIEVRDNGNGIPDGVLKRVFEPFFTTKAVGRGTGLGLAISRALVEAMGGDLSVESHPGVGTVFRVAIPAVAPDLDELSAAGVTDRAPAPVRAGRLLLADDETAVQQVFSRFLSHEGWEVKSVSSAADVLATLSKGDQYDAIVCSLALPDLSGVELFARATRERPELARAFVFVSSGTISDAIRTQLEATGLPVLSKPLTMSELMVPLGDLSNTRSS